MFSDLNEKEGEKEKEKNLLFPDDAQGISQLAQPEHLPLRI